MNFYKVFFATFLFFSSANAQSYLIPNSISPKLLEPALTVHSAAWQNEIEQVLKAQKNLNDEDLDEAIFQKHLQPETIAQAIDPTITRQNFPKLYHLMDRVGDSSRFETDAIKEYWNETRPYLADSRVKMFITPSHGSSYPSGHTTGSYVYANVLSLLFPQKREAIQNLAARIGQNRIKIGMHYPHDIRGGKTLAFFIVGSLTQSAEFQKDLQKALSEVESMEKK